MILQGPPQETLIGRAAAHPGEGLGALPVARDRPRRVKGRLGA